jgi:hypothetical protein
VVAFSVIVVESAASNHTDSPAIVLGLKPVARGLNNLGFIAIGKRP